MKKGKVGRVVERSTNITADVIGGVLRTALRVVISAVLVLLCSGLLFACILACYVKTSLSENLDVQLEEFTVSLSTSIWYTDSNGVDRKLTDLSAVENRTWLEYDEIPQAVKDAIVSIEDKRFYKHKGVDWYRTIGAFANMFLTMKNDFGGSTLTQQLIKNTTGNDDVTVQRKLLEIFQALDLEKKYTKEEILEWYLNYVYFGEGSYGIQAAAQTYFGKNACDLTVAECASIAGITNNPSKYDPFGALTITDSETGEAYTNREWNKKRQELILAEMYDQGYLTYDEYKQAVNEELNFVRAETGEYVQEIYSYYEEEVIAEVLEDLMVQRNVNEKTARNLLFNGGYQIYCCMDADIQAIVDDVYTDTASLPQPYYASGTGQSLQSAIVIMDPYTGEVVAISGGTGQKEVNFGTNRATQSTRPAGSSTKPLSVYGPALEYGLITQYTLVDDSPDIRLSGTSWYPSNSPNYYADIMTIRAALAASKNTVSAQILDKLTPSASYDYMVNKLGFTTLVEADRDYAPLALGQYTNGVTTLEMCQAYCSFVNSGTLTKARFYSYVTDQDGNVILENEPETSVAFSENTAANICDMLQNAVNHGTGSGAAINGMAVAGKTGTTSDNKDRYFCGFTPYYVAAVWTGYDMPEPMYYNSNPAVIIWHTIMERVHMGLEYRSFPTPWIGAATNIFGDLSEEYDRQLHPEKYVEEEPEEEEEPETDEKPAEEAGSEVDSESAGSAESETDSGNNSSDENAEADAETETDAESKAEESPEA